MPVFFTTIEPQVFNTMKGVKLTERIRYVHCEDPEGNHGVLVLLGAYGYPTKTLEVEDQADFRFAYTTFVDVEKRQAEIHRPTREAVAL